MRRLLWINVTGIALLCAACPNDPNGEVDKKKGKPAMDSVEVKSTSLEVDSTPVVKKEPKIDSVERAAQQTPKHSAPDQAKIDSIKAEKRKTKFKDPG